MAAKANITKELTAREAVDLGMFVCGSAKTVRETLLKYVKELGFGNLLAMLQFGTLPAELTRRNMERFAADVMPALKRGLDAEVAMPEAAVRV
jgi:hypothetical protein